MRLPLLFTALFAGSAFADLPAKVTFNDHVLPVFRNACLNCHNPDKKKAGLDLSTYQAALAGSDNGKVVNSGDAAASLLFKCCKGTEEPKMPPKGDRLTDGELALLEKWIIGQLLENSTSSGVAPSNNVQLAVVSLERPSGPPPMPGDLPLEPFVRTQNTNALVALAASPWAPLVAVGGQKQVVLHHSETLQPLGILPFPEGFPAIIRFSRNGQLLLAGGGLGGKSGKVVMWDVVTGERAGTVGNEFDQVLGADLSPDHAHVALGGPSRLLKLYATKDGKLVHTMKKHTDWITAVSFSPDGKYLASADRSGGIIVWEGTTGKEFNVLPGHKVAVTALAFMPGVLASASADGTVVLWDVKEGKEIRKWNAHAGGVEWVDFTADGRLVTCGRDKIAKAWDQTGKSLLASEPFGDIALRAVLGGNRIIAGDWTGRIRVFAMEGGKPVGELSANPPSLDEQLTSEQARMAEATAALPGLELALTAAEAKAAGGTPTAAPGISPEAGKALEDLQKRLDGLIAESAKQRERRGKQAEASDEYKDADGKVQGMKPQIAEVETKLAAAKTTAIVPVPTGVAAEIATARAAAEGARAQVAASTAALGHLRRAQAYMAVYTARQTLAEKKGQHEDLIAAAKDALTPIDNLKAQITTTEKLVAESPAKFAAAEKAGTDAQAAASKADAAVTVAEAAFTAAEVLAAADNGAVELADLQKKIAAEEAPMAEAQKVLDALNADIAQRRADRAKVPADSPEYAKVNVRVQEMKPRLVEAQTKADGRKAAVAALATTRDALAARTKDIPTKEVAAAAVANAKEALNQTRATASTAASMLASTQQSLAELKKSDVVAKEKLLADRKKLPELTRAAQAAKSLAEKGAVTAAKEMTGLRTKADRARVEFDSKYKPAEKAAALQVPQAKSGA